MYKPEVPGLEGIEAGVSVLKRRVTLFIKWIPRPDEVGAHEHRCGRAEKELIFQENKATDVATRHLGAGIGQTTERGVVTLEFISGDNADGGMRLGHLHHAPEATGKDPIVR